MRTATLFGPAPSLLCWAMAIALSPLFLLPPGLPQISHGLLAVMIAVMFTAGCRRPDHTLVLIGGAWLADVAIVNLAWFGVTDGSESKFLFSTAYYVFNFAVMVFVASLAAADPSRFRRWTCAAILVALAAQLVAVLLDGASRSSGTFENPNKLCYWALLLGALWFAVKPRAERMRAIDAAVMATTMAMCLASGSRSGIMGMAVLLVVPAWYHGGSSRTRVAVTVLAVAAGIVAVATSGMWLESLSDSATAARFGKDDPQDSFAARGYDRALHYPEYLIFGAGEGDYDRFPESLNPGLEIHSTFANILGSYGLLGSALFLTLLWWVFCRQVDRRLLWLFVPIALYGVAHNGLRAVEFWAFLGIALAAKLRQHQLLPKPILTEPLLQGVLDASPSRGLHHPHPRRNGGRLVARRSDQSYAGG